MGANKQEVARVAMGATLAVGLFAQQPVALADEAGKSLAASLLEEEGLAEKVQVKAAKNFSQPAPKPAPEVKAAAPAPAPAAAKPVDEEEYQPEQFFKWGNAAESTGGEVLYATMGFLLAPLLLVQAIALKTIFRIGGQALPKKL